ncbi:flagellar motor switch protein FliN [Cognatishimia sp. SS12]|uniref:flagellar motor switch protein FliN n=1 Tax=Cognatishimia sp. SS12 TaxID=2979465 RepID=UPI00232D6A05|nr:flagellar motor switch protein FliN [Cognatishimia sp. SS12]MDC0739420.1 flagellar motor switch protein FliN [Cognatishimia sp. SS12]
MSEDTPENGPDLDPPRAPEATEALESKLDATTLSAAIAEGQDGRNIDALYNVKLDVRVVLGRSRMSIADLLELTRGSVIELDRKVGDPIDIMINDRMVARGDLVKVNGDFIGVALREIVKDFIPGN